MIYSYQQRFLFVFADATCAHMRIETAVRSNPLCRWADATCAHMRIETFYVTLKQLVRDDTICAHMRIETINRPSTISTGDTICAHMRIGISGLTAMANAICAHMRIEKSERQQRQGRNLCARMN